MTQTWIMAGWTEN